MRSLDLRVAFCVMLAVGCGGESATTNAKNNGKTSGVTGRASKPATADAAAAGAAGTAADAGAVPATTNSVDLKTPIPEECQAFKLEGLKYSPGGDVLPNKCAPFNPTTNNPYAVRCIDAMPAFKTQFPGDEYCILPPPPDQGIQVGLHPQGDVDTYWTAMWAGDFSGYDNPPSEWVLKPGDEVTQNYRGHANNDQPLNYYRTYFRMRTGSHHNIITMHDGPMNDGWVPGSGEALPGLFDTSAGSLIGVLGGQQRPDDGTPVTFDKPPEDAGLYLQFPAHPVILYNMHWFNIMQRSVLREGWANLWKEDDARTLVTWYMGLSLTQVAALNVAPGSVADLHYAFDVAQPARILRVFGHRHAWTSNFSAWVEHAGADPKLIYQSYDWFDMPTYRYDSAAQNPKLDPEARTDGATSGVLNLDAGDKLHFNCHVEYTDARAAAVNAPKTPEQFGALHFANEAFAGEMCIQFGNVTGATLGLPSSQSTPVPDFATLTR